MSFGRMPIANGFLTPEQFAEEYFFELKPALCSSCGMFQIVDQPDERRMFHENYAFFSSTSRHMAQHFKRFAEKIMSDRLSATPFVVEIGCNDGIMLQHFARRQIAHLGVEPSANVAAVARKKGINVVREFFTRDLATSVVSKQGQADAILAANVTCHTPDFRSIAEGVGILLKAAGVFVFEEPYLGDMIEKTSYDQIYDEHVFIFSAIAIRNAFARYGMELIDLEPQMTHGGSMRYVIAHSSAYPVSEAVERQLAKERRLGLDRLETYEQFRENCEVSRDALMAVLIDLKAKEKRVVGYGATSKSTTVTNYCGITPDLVEFISDTTPIKQGKYSPGVHIPVKPYDAFTADYPDYALLFAWNHKAEIMEKEDSFCAAGGRWLVYVTKVQVF